MRRILATALLLFPLTAVWAFDITTCGVTIPPGAEAVLQNDIDCGGTSTGVTIEKRGVINLNGHTIHHPGGFGGIHCTDRRCTVVGPGAVADCSSVDGAFLDTGVRFVVGELAVDRCRAGIGTAVEPGNAPQSRVLAVDLTLRDNTAEGVLTGRFNGRGVTITGNGLAGIRAGRRIAGEHLTIANNGAQGLVSSRIKLTDATVTGNVVGAEFSHGSFVAATLTGNATADLLGRNRPGFVGSTCEHSLATSGPPGTTLGVCSGD